MKTVIWVVVYLVVSILVFTGWLICFSQHAPLNGPEPVSYTHLTLPTN